MRTCELEPFVSQVTVEDPPSGHSITLVQQEIEAYLARLLSAVCADLTDLDERVTALESP